MLKISFCYFYLVYEPVDLLVDNGIYFNVDTTASYLHNK